MATKKDSFAKRGKSEAQEREKRKHLRQKFQQVAVQALLKKGENDGRESDEEIENEFVMPKNVETSLNLSKMNLNEFPNELLDKMERVQYLYLEGTKLTELPERFFEKLPSLKWLDLRNNALTSLPTIGLKNHPSLEVVLLQGNRIRNLPIELATVSSLKGLQTTGNPLTNVPYDCIAEGFNGIMNHLKKLSSQNDILASPSEMIMVKPSTSRDETLGKSATNATESIDAEMRNIWDSEKLSQWRQFIRKKSQNSNLKIHSSQKEKFFTQKPKTSAVAVVRSRPKSTFRPIPFRCGTYSRRRRKTGAASALHYLKLRRTKFGYKSKPITMAAVEEKARREAHTAQVREMLEKQARKIQRMRDKEVLKSWRDHARFTRNQIKLLDNYQQYPSKDFASRTPFDVDPEFLNMLNRVDLYRSLKDCESKSRRISRRPKIRLTALDLERQMNEIVSKLKNLDTGEGEEDSTVQRSDPVHVCDKMSKILDIQKTLRKLQTLNSSLTDLTPALMARSKK